MVPFVMRDPGEERRKHLLDLAAHHQRLALLLPPAKPTPTARPAIRLNRGLPTALGALLSLRRALAVRHAGERP